MAFVMLATATPSIEAEKVKQATNESSFTSMLNRAEAIINYEWIPQERIYTWNDNLYQGKNYFEKGETIKGVPYTLFSWELGFDSLLSLEQYKEKAVANYSTSAYCSSMGAERTGPIYGNCCGTFVSEVFGGHFMNGSNPVYDGVGTIQSSTYSTTYKKVKISAIQPGDALSCTSGSHIIWVGGVTNEAITIYESTPPICRKIIVDKSSHTDSNGYLIYNGNVYNIVTKCNDIIRDDLCAKYSLSETPMPLFAYTEATAKTIVYDGIDGKEKANKIYGTDLCLIDAIFSNGWCHVNFPLDAGGLDHGYVKTSVFYDTNFDVTEELTRAGVPVYTREDFSASSGRIAPGSTLCKVGETQKAIQVIYSLTTGGYKLGWISKDDLSKTAEVPFLSAFCPIKGYPCVNENFVVQQSDYTTRGGEIYTTDYCTINAIYADGWCQVTFPMDSGGERTAYTALSNFVYDTDYMPTPYTTTENITVYPKKDLSATQNWWTGTGDTIYILGEYGNALQICYPIDDLYGGGYKLGWIYRDSVSVSEKKTVKEISVESMPNKTTYQIGDSLNTAGLSIKVTYSDNSTKTVTSGFSVSGFESNTAGIKTVTVSYEGKTTTFKVTVENTKTNVGTYTLTEAAGAAGSTVEVYLSIDDNPGVITLKNSISYDTSALELVKIEDFSLLKGYSEPSPTIGSPYILSWLDAVAKTNNVSNGKIAKLTFKIKANAQEGSYNISVNHLEAGNIDGAKVTFASASSKIKVTQYIPGDVDNDGEVTDWDAVVLKRYLAGWNNLINTYAADVDADGTVSDWDAVLLMRYLAGWEVKLD